MTRFNNCGSENTRLKTAVKLSFDISQQFWSDTSLRPTVSCLLCFLPKGSWRHKFSRILKFSLKFADSFVVFLLTSRPGPLRQIVEDGTHLNGPFGAYNKKKGISLFIYLIFNLHLITRELFFQGCCPLCTWINGQKWPVPSEFCLHV